MCKPAAIAFISRPAASQALTAALATATAIVCLLAVPAAHAASPVSGRDAHWDPGSADCAASPGPALEVHRYDARTFILREGLCATFEAPFMYLLMGQRRALLIDSGGVEDPSKVDLGQAVSDLLPAAGAHKLPLLVVHTHGHLDHRAGDRQLARMPDTQVVGSDLESVKQFYNLPQWPEGTALLDLGGRFVDVIPTPGHHETEVTFYDRTSGLVFSGDFLLPARIRINDLAAYRSSAARLMRALDRRRMTAFMGGHIEMDAQGRLFRWQSQYHPDERALPMGHTELPALAEALARFNGLYTESGGFTMVSTLYLQEAVAAAVLPLVLVVLWGVVRLLLRRRAHRAEAAAVAG